jgi:hypothetical protein
MAPMLDLAVWIGAMPVFPIRQVLTPSFSDVSVRPTPALMNTAGTDELHRPGARMTTSPPSRWQIPAASSPDPIERAAVLGPVKAKALRVAAKTRPALTDPARDGCEIQRSGRKNARGAGRTKE